MRWSKGRSNRLVKRSPWLRRLQWIGSGNAAAWVQAVGAIVALYLTLHLSYQTAWEGESKAAELAAFSGGEMVRTMKLGRSQCKQRDDGGLRSTILILDQVSRTMGLVNQRDLQSDALSDWFEMRRFAAEAQAAVQQALNVPPSETQWQICIDKLSELIAVASWREKHLNSLYLERR